MSDWKGIEWDMIFDGQWKAELQSLSRAIAFWRKWRTVSDLAKHRLNRAILYSAVVLRKAMEDEREAEEIAKANDVLLPKQELLHAKLSAMQYPYTTDDAWFVRGKICPEDYGKGEATTLPANTVCNQLLHSYVWSLVSAEGEKGYRGFLVSSDKQKEKCVFFISFDEWLRLIQTAIAHGAF